MGVQYLPAYKSNPAEFWKVHTHYLVCQLKEIIWQELFKRKLKENFSETGLQEPLETPLHITQSEHHLFKGIISFSEGRTDAALYAKEPIFM